MPRAQITYTSKRWLKKPKPIETLIRDLGFRLVGKVSNDDFIVQRRGEHRPVFHMLHISWGDKDAVEKYKLFRIDPFTMSDLEEVVETPNDRKGDQS